MDKRRSSADAAEAEESTALRLSRVTREGRWEGGWEAVRREGSSSEVDVGTGSSEEEVEVEEERCKGSSWKRERTSERDAEEREEGEGGVRCESRSSSCGRLAREGGRD